ncbi:hypothetical protein QYE76_068879 [Lolium multiflorum]|uniref:FBD domain-containing protein n=1 Tax=Lolium multiflorum TaxID=4521 RepID=A0AAD8SFN4_LOLMU|nr:hypothetical protein QYE76_068879 [Lolium multiflorum]
MLHLLRRGNGIRNLVASACPSKKRRPCPLSCACRTPESCRADTITLDSLEEVEIESFTGADDQMEFLRQLVFICRAPQLASVKITACPHSPLNNDVQEKIHVFCFIH